MALPLPLQFLIATVAHAINERLPRRIEFLLEENRIRDMAPVTVRAMTAASYRCRGKSACRGTHVAAEDIEQRVLAWLRNRIGGVSPEASFMLTRYEPIWKVLSPESIRRSVAQRFSEVRWDGPKNKFAVVRDEAAIAEEYAKITRNDQEPASQPKPRRRKTRRRHARPRDVDRAGAFRGLLTYSWKPGVLFDV